MNFTTIWVFFSDLIFAVKILDTKKSLVFCFTPQPKTQPKTTQKNSKFFPYGKVWKKMRNFRLYCRIFTWVHLCCCVIWVSIFLNSGRKSCLKLERTCNPVFARNNIYNIYIYIHISYLPYPPGVCWWIFVHAKMLAHSPGQCRCLKPETIHPKRSTFFLDRSFGRIEVIKEGQREKGWVFLGI